MLVLKSAILYSIGLQLYNLQGIKLFPLARWSYIKNDFEGTYEAAFYFLFNFAGGASELIQMLTRGTRCHTLTPSYLHNKPTMSKENLADLQGISLHSWFMV